MSILTRGEKVSCAKWHSFFSWQMGRCKNEVMLGCERAIFYSNLTTWVLFHVTFNVSAFSVQLITTSVFVIYFVLTPRFYLFVCWRLGFNLRNYFQIITTIQHFWISKLQSLLVVGTLCDFDHTQYLQSHDRQVNKQYKTV